MQWVLAVLLPLLASESAVRETTTRDMMRSTSRTRLAREELIEGAIMLGN